MKPILFNTEMVRAILDGRKSVMRRVVKPKPLDEPMVFNDQIEGLNIVCHVAGRARLYNYFPNYQTGDILYVRETWQRKRGGGYLYKADTDNSFDLYTTPDGRVVGTIPWRPSIHMPKEAARLFLRVTDVQVERLQDIADDEILAEGIRSKKPEWVRIDFADLWNATIKKADLPFCGWNANPWVWVIEFERISKEEAYCE